MFIYLITNLLNGKRYVGQTVRPLRRRFTLHANDKRSHILSRAIQKSGRENFTIEKLEECQSPAEMDSREQFWIGSLGTVCPKGYNLHGGGQGCRTVLEITKQKLRRAWKLRQPDSAETRARKSLSAKKRISANKSLYVSYLKKSYGHRKGLAAQNRRPVRCSNGNTYVSAAHASSSLGLDHSSVSAAARGRLRQTGGYSFEYID